MKLTTENEKSKNLVRELSELGKERRRVRQVKMIIGRVRRSFFSRCLVKEGSKITCKIKGMGNSLELEKNGEV